MGGRVSASPCVLRINHGIVKSMKTSIKGLLSITLLVAGCAPAKLVMKLDKTLEDNATVYELSYPHSLKDKISGKRLNVAFGPYRVSDADMSWTRTASEAEDPAPLVNIKHTEKSGNTSTTTEISAGPTSIFGLKRPVREGDTTIDEKSRSISYRFHAGQNNVWHASCTYYAKQRVTPAENSNSIDMLDSKFSCHYKPGGTQNVPAWTLSLDHQGVITVTQTGSGNSFLAHATGGAYLLPDGKIAQTTTRTTGYTWFQLKDGREKSVAAISVIEEAPRVWLGKANSAATNQILALASTGLLIYSWEIRHY